MLKKVDVKTAMGMVTTRPVMIITTVHGDGTVNAGVFGSYTNLSPDQLGVAVSTGSHTYANIMRSGEFVINVPGKKIVSSIKVLASNIPQSKSELEEAGLTVEGGGDVGVPHIQECVGCVECRFEGELEIGVHSFLVGRCVGGFARDEFITPQGCLDVVRSGIFHCHRYPEDCYMLFGKEIRG